MFERRSKPGWGCLCLLMAFPALLVLSSLIRPHDPSGTNRPRAEWRAAIEATPQQKQTWQAALQSGDGTDWFALSDRDQTVLCLEAAKALGQDRYVAIEYEVFLHTFYREPNPTTRSKKIAEILAVCQTLIQNGVIEVDR